MDIRYMQLEDAIKAGTSMGILFMLRDKAGVNIIVNTVTGKVIGYCDETTSKKEDGYLVTVFNYEDVDGSIYPYRVKTQRLVKMVTDLAHCSEDMVINHINNCPFCNEPSNLEITDTSGNNRHGKLVNSIHKYYPGKYTHIEHNQSTTDFVVLDSNRLITVDDCNTFHNIYGGLAIRPKTEDKLYDISVVDAFIAWMFSTKRWK